MLTILHGDNVKDSRQYYFDLKQKESHNKTLAGEKASLTDIVEAVEGDGLFSTEDPVFIELLLSKKRAGRELDGIILYLNKEHEAKITLWEQKEIDKKLVKKFPKATIKVFSYPQTLFHFLDAFGPNNASQLIPLFHQTLATTEVEIILFMLAKQVRLLLAMRDQQEDTISEAKYLQPWQKTKLIKQAKLFSTEALVTLHEKIYTLDIGYKTGQLAYPLTDSLDFFLAEV